jgi:DNA-binding NarL/FixJ family response regulator
MSQITVLLAEDHAIVRKGLRALLDDEADLRVLAEAADGREALEKTEQLGPDIVVMDIAMPSLNGLEATRQIRQRCPAVKVLILTMHTSQEYVLQVLRAGASGYVVKQAAPDELIVAIWAVHRGDTFLSPRISKAVVDQYLEHADETRVLDSLDLLTDREREVLQLIAEGHPAREIGEILHISVKTAGTHRAHLMQKLSLRSTAELTQYAIRKGVISLDT